ncbi:OsmC family protein, partial [Leclercia adecarboxylata]|uniref:OsmC family protein n=1 Tax=Leclercia adecarboxylata TaxID=83655 RepID=UPI00234CF55F
NQGTGTSSLRGYSRNLELHASGKPPILGSSDPSFRGDSTRWNPEDMLVASLPACHELWYLGLCAAHGVIVQDYVDGAEGWMTEEPDGAGQFTRVLLRPVITLAAGADLARAESLHHDAHEKCFIARSVNFPVEIEPRFIAGV